MSVVWTSRKLPISIKFNQKTILTIFMSVVWTSWKLPISIKFNQKFHTPEDLIRGPRSNLDPTSDLDPTSHLDPTSTRPPTPTRPRPPPRPHLGSISASRTSPNARESEDALGIEHLRFHSSSPRRGGVTVYASRPYAVDRDLRDAVLDELGAPPSTSRAR